jgi:hypothetical protein
MTNRKLLLNNLLDIGGVCTMGNLYSPEARTYKGSLNCTREYIKFYLDNGFIEKMPPVGTPMNRAKEVFYQITKKGAQYIGRVEDFKRKPDPKSFNLVNVMHESMKFDFCLAFLRLYPEYTFEIEYNKTFGGIRPDAVIRMTDRTGKEFTFYLEIERKKTISRTFNEKVMKYHKYFGSKAVDFRVLFVYSDLTFNVFKRPQEYTAETFEEISRLNLMVHNLAKKCKNLPNIYRFLEFPRFNQLNQPIWLDTKEIKRSII